MDAPRTWQALSVATAAVALGVGAALVRAPASVPAPPIELAVVAPLDRDPVPSAGDEATSPTTATSDPRIVLPQLRQGGTPISVASATSSSTPDDPASTTRSSAGTSPSTGPASGSGGSGSGSGGSGSGGAGSGSGGSSSTTTSTSRAGSGGPAGATASADSSDSVASPSSTDSD